MDSDIDLGIWPNCKEDGLNHARHAECGLRYLAKTRACWALWVFQHSNKKTYLPWAYKRALLSFSVVPLYGRVIRNPCKAILTPLQTTFETGPIVQIPSTKLGSHSRGPELGSRSRGPEENSLDHCYTRQASFSDNEKDACLEKTELLMRMMVLPNLFKKQEYNSVPEHGSPK